MQTYLIIADDFTGANDTGLQLVRRSVKVRVQIGRPGLLPPSYSLVLDTESRNLSPQRAREAVQASLLDMDMASFSVVMKKIDSTLRGNIVEEVSEVAKRMQACIIVVATAFPDMGRICKDSVVYVHEKPLREPNTQGSPQTVTEKPVKSLQLVQPSGSSECGYHPSPFLADASRRSGGM